MSDDKRLNEVIRVQKRHNNFVMMDKAFLENSDLSWKAKGILAYLLSKPDNWKVIVGDVIKHATDGKSAVYSGLAELKECGYYEKVPVRNETGAFERWESTVYELPKATNPQNAKNAPSSPLTDFPEMDKPEMEKPYMENRERNNNYINNNYKAFNNNQSSQVLSATPSRQDKDRTEDNTAQKIEAYIALIKENISYGDYAVAHKYDMQLVDEFIDIILDVLLSEGKTVRINGEDKPRELVKHNLLRLNYSDMEHAVSQFKGVTGRISKKKQYIITLLYNCKIELDSHYTNLVKHDMWHGGDE